MNVTDDSVQKFLDGIDHSKRRRDAGTMLQMMGRVTGEKARMWGTVIGFGQYHYKYKSGREGDSGAAGFSPRKTATTVYLPDGVGAHTELLDQLGPHTTGVGCVYIKDLEEVDLKVLEAIVARSYATVTAGTYTARAREGGHS
jgi:hypothetical protein